MSSGLIAFVGVIYAIIAVEQFAKKNPGMGIVFAGYALANIGLYAGVK